MAWIAVFALTVAAAGVALLVRTAVFEGSSSSTAAVQGSGIPITQTRHLSRADSGCAGSAWGWSGGGEGYKAEVWVNEYGARVAVLLLNARVKGGGGDAPALATMESVYCAA